jgi:[amino group carrier protein]-lysine/ornithine hydrolase
MTTHPDIALLEGAIRIDSPSTHESAVAHYLVTAMQQRGLRSYVDRVGNAIGQIGSHGPEIVLLGHIDTAPGHVPVEIRDGKLYGRGSVDAKGPFVAFIGAATALMQQGALPFRLTLIGAVEEEYATSRGAHYAAQRYQPDACIIGEPSGWDRVTLGYKGRILLDITTRQGSAHSAGPEQSAPERCMAVWQAIQRYCNTYNADKPRLFDQYLPSLRHIASGSDGLKDWAHAVVGIRLPPQRPPWELIHDIGRLGDEHTTLLFRDVSPAWQSPRSDAAANAFVQGIRACGGQPGYLLKTGTADMNVVGPTWRCPIIAYGPGDSTLDHTPHEHIELAEFMQSIQVLTHALPLLAKRLAP